MARAGEGSGHINLALNTPCVKTGFLPNLPSRLQGASMAGTERLSLMRNFHGGYSRAARKSRYRAVQPQVSRSRGELPPSSEPERQYGKSRQFM